MINTMVAPHAMWPKKDDPIFGISNRAKEAVKKYGASNVIDSTLGVLADDEGKLICMESVYSELKALPNAEIAAYAPIAGSPDFLEAVQNACFREYRPEGFIKAVASPGGTGSIKLAVYNYTNPEDSVLVSDWYWTPYHTIAEETGRKIANYTMFNEKNEFNMVSFKENFESLLKKQKRVITIINTPAQNPTGYSLSDEEWAQVLDIAKENAKDPENKIVIFVDVAYMDFAGVGTEKRKFFTQFSNLPENILIIIGYSMSKGYSMYGARSGAAICISSNKDVADEFYYSCMHSCRANWSNGNRGAMSVMCHIANDPVKLKRYEDEKAKYKAMLQRRAKAFVDASSRVGLDILPYRDGFFVSIPCEDPMSLCDELAKENLFLVPLKKGLRFAVCAVSEDKCKLAPAIIKKVFDKANKK